MNFFTFSSILIVISCSISSAFLFKEAKRNQAILIWGFVTVLATIWGIGAIIFSTTTNYNRGVLGWQIGAIASILAPLVHHHFVLAYLNKVRRPTIYLLYTYGGIALFYELLFPNYFFGNLDFLFNEFYFIKFVQLNNLPYFIHYLLAHNVLLLYSFSLLLKEYIKSKDESQNRHKYLILGSGIGWLGTHGDFLTSLSPSFYPYSNALLAIFPLIITYAIIRHQLLDIKIIIKKSIVYTILITILTIFYFSAAYLTERFFQNIFGYRSTITSFGLAIIVALIFIPLRDLIQAVIDNIFFKGTTSKLAEENEILRREVADKEKFKAIATLASGIAHDVRNPMTALKTFFDFYPQKKNDPEFINKFLELGQKELKRVENLTQQLMDFAKPSTPVPVPTSISELIKHALDLLQHQFTKNNIQIHTHFAQDLPHIAVDANQIKQTLINLITNAIDAMPQGGQLTIKTTLSGSFVEIWIKDTGYGIAPEDLRQIFNPFFTKKDGGTGLGLAICYGIISEHGGKITAESQINVGTTFRILLPIND